ncbi:MAG: hypothetical protein ACJA2G_003655, partial [Cognaticolwellia sp.]
MNIVPIEQWNETDASQLQNHQVLSFSDMRTINKLATTARDFALALQGIAGDLYDYEKQVVAVKRNQADDAWLVLC